MFYQTTVQYHNQDVDTDTNTEYSFISRFPLLPFKATPISLLLIPSP